ncbi:hypothetical protein HS088_TW13G01628 [Tripterygium wilfordii]|uniref:Uncharacterized protein n=1 Tax=Tripterygium wilfordii TaxID=458696 RepID=A0A7J7CX93_TRIWF|nr:uncharacterized protein LOC120012613 [Tripterygium wilfordii]KAF5738727.1 hypothetical protein HS088_TW13G01628 [Tripterygium wilfordii]
MEGIKGGGGGGGGGGDGGGRVVVGEDDMGDSMQCSDHPYRNNPGGICAFCLQEKLGKLVSSSFPLPVRGPSSSSSSPSVRSDIGSSASAIGTTGTSSFSLAVRPTTREHQEFYARRSRIPFLLAKKKKKTTASSQSDRDIVFKRSKSTTTPRRNRNFLDNDDGDYLSPRKRTGFWSFLYKTTNNGKKTEKKITSFSAVTAVTTPAASAVKPKERCLGSSSSKRGDNTHNIVVEEDDEFSPNSQATASASSFERKVSRSRSVGCGSRSFSGDFFERISTGFGDCTLRRVESQREGKPKNPPGVMKERVKCGGLFSGFIMTSSSSSSSSSSYWVSSSSAEDMNRKSTTAVTAGPHLNVHGRSKSWGWAFASPMRAFSTKPSSKDGNKRNSIIREASSKKTTPDLNAIPSLLAVRS